MDKEIKNEEVNEETVNEIGIAGDTMSYECQSFMHWHYFCE